MRVSGTERGTQTSLAPALALILGASLGIPGTATAADRFSAVKLHIRQYMRETGAPSVAISVARHGQIVWEEGFGWADRERRIAATAYTPYMIASTSKPLTGTALMLLVQAGKVELDRPINDYLGPAKLRARMGDAQDATVRRVANHTSGLPMHCQIFFAGEETPTIDVTLMRYGNLIARSAERYEYSNLGYGALEAVVQRVSGMPFADFMRSELFSKLGMTSSAVGRDSQIEELAAVAYDDTLAPIPRYTVDTAGAGGMFSSTHDLVRFGMLHLKDHVADQAAILSDASVDAMHQPTSRQYNGQGYGVGWAIETRADGYHELSHGGNLPGVHSIYRMVPSEHIVVSLLSNKAGDFNASNLIVDEVLGLLLPKRQTDPPSSNEAAASPSVRLSRPGSLIGTWSGMLDTYQAEIPLRLTVSSSGEVFARLGDQLEALVNDVRFEDGWLTGKMTGDMGTDDVRRRHVEATSIVLKLRGATLNGGMMADSHLMSRARSRRDVGETMDVLQTTQWVELKKEPPKS